MNSVETWGGAISKSLFDLWMRFVSFLPTILGAILIFVIGMVVASIMGKVVEKIIKLTHIDEALAKLRVSQNFKEAGLGFSFSGFFGELVCWFLLLVFLMAATDVLGLNEVTTFLNQIILYIPNVIVATVILAIAFLLGNFVHTVVRSSTRAAGVMSATLLAVISKWAIMIFGLLAALIQLGIATSLVNTIFIGIIAALSLAAGLAFGLGGKEEAALILKKIREEISQR